MLPAARIEVRQPVRSLTCERQEREIEKLREKLTDRDRKLAEAEKQIADLLRTFCLRILTLTFDTLEPRDWHGWTEPQG